jgi:hypothetical protein
MDGLSPRVVEKHDLPIQRCMPRCDGCIPPFRLHLRILIPALPKEFSRRPASITLFAFRFSLLSWSMFQISCRYARFVTLTGLVLSKSAQREHTALCPRTYEPTATLRVSSAKVCDGTFR